jgi:hypothetical protein
MVDLTPRDVPEQRLYARVLAISLAIGLVGLAVAFAAYLLELFPTRVPIAALSEVWSQPASPSRVDFASLAPIGWLALCSCVALAAAMRIYLGRRDTLYASLCALQIMVLALAATGIFTLGH